MPIPTSCLFEYPGMSTPGSCAEYQTGLMVSAAGCGFIDPLMLRLHSDLLHDFSQRPGLAGLQLYSCISPPAHVVYANAAIRSRI